MQMTVVLVIVLVAILTISASVWRKVWKTDRIGISEVGLLYGSSGFVRELPPGLHHRFDVFGRDHVVTVGTATHALSGQVIEAISKDQFAFRVTLTPIVTVIDPRLLVERAANPSRGAEWSPDAARYDRLAPTIAAATLAVVASRTLEEFLADPSAIIGDIAPRLVEALPGTKLDDLLLTGVTLPPEVRKMFTEVERARREGLAGLERARAEQASLRALANAARNLADNPALANLRMLQVMENAKGAKTFVLGNTAQDPSTPQP